MPMFAERNAGGHAAARARRTAEPAVVAPFQNPADANAEVAVVIVVAAKCLAERADRNLVRVAEVDSDRFQLAAVELAAEHATPAKFDLRAVRAGDLEAGI